MEMVMGNVMVAKSMPPRREQRVSQPPLPNWVSEVRPGQKVAVQQVVRAFDSGARVVFLDAPTGTGKSLVGELVRRELDVARGLYVCTTKSLQDQYLRDFGYARVLKGRGNYVPSKLATNGRRQQEGLTISCNDCDAGPTDAPREEQSCSYCYAVDDCPYSTARQEALMAPVGVLNTAFLLSHCNYAFPKPDVTFHGRQLVVADEGDMLEEQLMGFAELRLTKRLLATVGMEAPKKGSHMTTIRTWLEGDVQPELIAEAKRQPRTVEGRRMHTRLTTLTRDVDRVLQREDGWVREGDEEGDRSPDALVLKPVAVNDVGDKYLWRHHDNWLCMSGTIISPEMMADQLGLDEAGIEWDSVKIGMGFAKENRRVVYVPAGEMTRKGQARGDSVRVIQTLKGIVAAHPGVNVLVHSHTYKLAAEVTDALKGESRPVLTYTSSWDRDKALARFKREADRGGAVLVASSMDRGIDLPGELCRVQIVVKMPMASLGSRQVSERMRLPGGQLWYLANTVRGLVQMTGRAVRSDSDHAVTYVLDSHFGKILADGKKWGLWPQWWLDALELGRIKEYV